MNKTFDEFSSMDLHQIILLNKTQLYINEVMKVPGEWLYITRLIKEPYTITTSFVPGNRV